MIKRILTNIDYFKISRNNPEEVLDSFYVFDEQHPQLQKYIANTKEIKNILITIKILKEKKENKKIIKKYLLELSHTLGNFSNCSEFACFINACDSFVALAKNDVKLLEEITQRYFYKRTLNETIPPEWIQAILDSNSGRRKGHCGEQKLLQILTKNGFQIVKTWEAFSNTPKCVVQFSQIFNTKSVREHLNVELRTTKQNKKLDLIVKTNKRIFLCEAKHLNTSGGGQDKQISELIEIIGLDETEENISYIAFLDGSYSNILLSKTSGSEKLETQRNEIKQHLIQNPANFWVNTTGFKALFKE